MMIAGSVFAIVGLVKIMAGKKKIIYKANGCPMKRCDLYFDNHEMHRLQQSLENKQFDVLPKLKPAEGNKAGIKQISLCDYYKINHKIGGCIKIEKI